jgi:hypothetical protein
VTFSTHLATSSIAESMPGPGSGLLRW